MPERQATMPARAERDATQKPVCSEQRYLCNISLRSVREGFLASRKFRSRLPSIPASALLRCVRSRLRHLYMNFPEDQDGQRSLLRICKILI